MAGMPPVSDSPVRVGSYVVEDLVVTSAFSRVYRARDDALGRRVAIKVFHLAEAKAAGLPYPPEEWRRRFVAEARILARVDHPNVVRVENMGWLADGTPFMVMPWHVANLRVEIGRDTHDPERIAALSEGERPRPMAAAARACAVLRQACLGLAALHAQGVVHRDVKPTNLLLTARQGGIVRLCDLGMAKLPRGEAASRGGVWIGTESYCAPEQRDASRVTDRADVYAVGVLAYRLLTGRLPQGAFPPPSALAAVGAGWDELVRAAMNPLAAERPTAVQLAARLAALARESV